MSTFALAGFSVDPVTLEIVTLKGSESEGIFKVRNTGKNPVRVRVELNKWKGTDMNAKGWIDLEPVDFKLDPSSSKDVTYKIAAPGDSSGELRCMLFFVADELGENKSAVGIRFGVPVYVVVGGTEVIEAEIEQVNVSYNSDKNILSGTIHVNNKSNVHIRPHIDIEIFSKKGDLTARFSPKYGQPAQRKQVRSFLFQKGLKLEDGKYKLVAKVDYGRLFNLKDKIAEKEIEFAVGDKEEILNLNKEKEHEEKQ